jgi:hypothetical protein
MKFQTHEWGKSYNERINQVMVILTTEDVEQEKTDSLLGVGYEILVLPIKYKDVSNDFLNNARYVVICRKGKVIYV